MCGDRVNSVHKMRTLDEYPDRIVVYCERCRKKYSVHPKDPRYLKLFQRDTLQPGTNLYYREFPKSMKIA
jgi:hypothetical protein